MAADSPDGVDAYLLAISDAHREELAYLRPWIHLKMASDGGTTWVRDFTREQIESVAVKRIPYKELYYLKGNQLFPLGSLLPQRRLPALLWTPIESALPVTLPEPTAPTDASRSSLTVPLVPAVTEREPAALLTSLAALATWLPTAPAVRLRSLTWVIVNETQALVLGAPLLPLLGLTFWQNHGFLLPTGYDFAWPAFAEIIHWQLNAGNDQWILWQPEGVYSAIPRSQLRPLSIGSFRQSVLEP